MRETIRRRAKDPGFDVDLVCRGKIADFVEVYLDHKSWREADGRSPLIEGDRQLARKLPSLVRLDKVVGRGFPVVSQAA